MVALFEPVSREILDALPEALAWLVRHDSDGSLRRRRTSGGWVNLRAAERADLSAWASAAVVQHPAGMSAPELGVLAHNTGYPGPPMALHLSGAALAIMLPHDLVDGTGAWEQVDRLFLRAAGVEARSRPAVDRFPVLSALRRTGLLDRDNLAAARTARRAAVLSADAPPMTDHDILPDDARRADGIRTIWLSDQRLTPLTSLSTARGTTGRGLARGQRTTMTMRLSALVLETAREIFPDGADLGMRMAMDLRRYLPKGHTVAGPFSTTYPLGTLRTMNIHPDALGESTAAAVASSAPLAGFVADVGGYLRARVKHPAGLPAGSPGRRSFNVIVSALPTRLPDSFWATDGDRLKAAMLLHPTQVTDPYVQIAHVAGGTVIALWEEAGISDHDAFEATFNRLLDARYPPT